MFGKKYMRESSLAKYSIVATPANMDTIKISNSISDNLKSHLSLNDTSDLFEEVFGQDSASEMMFYKEKFTETEKLLRANGLEINNGLILFNGVNIKTIADERKRVEIMTDAKFVAEQIKKQLQGN